MNFALRLPHWLRKSNGPSPRSDLKTFDLLTCAGLVLTDHGKREVKAVEIIECLRQDLDAPVPADAVDLYSAAIKQHPSFKRISGDTYLVV